MNQFVKDCFKEKKLSIKREIDKLAIELNTTYTNLRYQIYGWYPLTQELAERLSKMIDVPTEELFKLSYEPENSKCDKFPEWINLLISVKPYFKYLDKTAKSRRKDQIGYLIFLTRDSQPKLL